MLVSGQKPVARHADLSRRAAPNTTKSDSARPRRAIASGSPLNAGRIAKTAVGAVATAALVGGMGWAATGTAEAAKGDNMPVLKQGQRSSNVKRLQRELSAYGPNVPSTGYFGSMTRDRVNRLKSNEGLAVDGVAGPRTWRVLFSDGNFVARHSGGSKSSPSKAKRSGGSKVGSNMPQLRTGDRSGKVRRLQRELSAYGKQMPTTGYFGSITRSRVNQLKKREGFRPDGVAGFRVWHTLFTDGNKLGPNKQRSGGSSRSSNRPSVGSNTVWDRLAECESGGNWSINTGNGFYGGLQFTPSTWRAFGGSGMPHHASRAEQIRVAKKTQQVQGWGAWPACSSKLGLR